MGDATSEPRRRADWTCPGLNHRAMLGRSTRQGRASAPAGTGRATDMSYTVVTDVCTADENCVAVCPVDCITFPADTGGKAHINQDECIDCAACVEECPVDAILAS